MNNEKHTQYMIKYLSPLIGKKVKRVVRDGGTEHADECVGLEFEDGTTAWIMCDPEGNGPGFLSIEKP